MSFSNYTSQAVLNSLFGKTSNFGALASEPAKYVALYTTAPAEDGTGGVEVSGNGYTRVSTTAANWDVATLANPSVLSNSADIEFPSATGPWGEIVAFGIMDAATDGNYLIGSTLNVAKSPTDGDVARFAAGQLSVSLT